MIVHDVPTKRRLIVAAVRALPLREGGRVKAVEHTWVLHADREQAWLLCVGRRRGCRAARSRGRGRARLWSTRGENRDEHDADPCSEHHHVSIGP